MQRKEQIFLIKVFTLDKEKLDLPLKEINFLYLKEILRKNCLLSVFYYNMQRLGLLEIVPFRDWLKEFFYGGVSRNVKLQEVYRQIYRECQAAGIEILPLKGINLIEYIYPNIGMRDLTDIDIYCKIDDYQKLKNLLIAKGFIYDTAKDISSGRINCEFKKEDELPGSEILVEVHTAVSPCRPYPVRLDLFGRKREYNGVNYLSSEDLFINLLFKIRRDAWKLTLIYFYDLYAVAKKEKNLDWQYIINMCRENRILKVLYFSLYYLEEIFGKKFYHYPKHWFYRFFKKNDCFQWTKAKGCFLRLNFLNTFDEFFLYVIKKWL